MRIKTYFAGTVEAAIGLAARELGGDALLLASRPASAATRHLGAYEVVFGIPGPAAASLSLRAFLARQDFHPALIERVLGRLEAAEASDSEVWEALRETVTFDPWDPAQPYRLALVGPCGGGKTSTTLKIALQSGQKFRIFDADERKVGPQLARAASLSGLEYSTVVPEEFVSRAGQSGSFLLDLDGAPGEAWAEALTQTPDLTVCLVLPATWRTADLAAAAERYRNCRPARLILTHFDQTSCAGGALSAAAMTGLPLFAFGFSPELVGGIEPAGECRLQDLLFERQPAQTLAAAAGGFR